MILKQTLSLIFFSFVFFFTLLAFVIKCVLWFFLLFIICSFTLGSIKLTLFFVVGFSFPRFLCYNPCLYWFIFCGMLTLLGFKTWKDSQRKATGKIDLFWNFILVNDLWFIDGLRLSVNIIVLSVSDHCTTWQDFRESRTTARWNGVEISGGNSRFKTQRGGVEG